MKRVLLALLLLWPAIASAKVAIITDRPNGLTGATGLDYMWRSSVHSQVYATGLFDRIGGTYDTHRIDAVKTEWFRTGIFPGATYDAIMWVGVFESSLANNRHPPCYPCSLSLTARLPLVPQLWVSHEPAEGTFSGTTSCSLNTYGTCGDPGSQAVSAGAASNVLNGTTYRWPTEFSQGVSTTGTRVLPRIINGTQRRLLQRYAASPTGWYPTASFGGDRDSLYTSDPVGTPSGYDSTAIVGIKYNDYVIGTGAGIFANDPSGQRYSPIVNVQYVNGNFTDVGLVSRWAIGDPTSIYLAMAWVDSLTSHAVFGSSPKPVKAAIQVVGLCSRGGEASSGGPMPSDSTIVKAGIGDSLATLNANLPITFFVNVDSVATYPNDLNWAKRAGSNVRFSPYSNFAIDSTAASGNTSQAHPRDIFGHYRKRTFYGPAGTGAAKDTSIYALVVAAKAILTAQGCALSSSIIAPLDDWSPLYSLSGGGGMDSLVYVLSLAGFSNLTSDAERDSMQNTERAEGRSWGYFNGQNRVTVSSGTLKGMPFSVLCYPGAKPDGAKIETGSSALVPTAANGYEDMQFYEARFMRGLVCPAWSWPQNRTELFSATNGWTGETGGLGVAAVGSLSSISPLANTNTGTNVFRLYVSDFGSGGTVGSTTAPNRPGWWMAKHLWARFQAINAVAGRSLFKFCYPEELTPKDISR